MNARTAPPVLLLVLGVVLVQLVRTEAHLRYVKGWLGVPLVISGLALVALGAAGVYAAARAGRPDRPGPSQVGWLLVVPVGLLLLVDPPALGSYGLSGRATAVTAPTEALGSLPPPRDGAVELTLREYARRVAYEPAGLDQTRLRLVGFAVPPTAQETARHGAGFYLTRIALNCCAADGQAVRVFVRTPDRPPADTWWQVEASAELPAAGSATDADAVLRAGQLTAIATPTNPYSY